VGPHGPPPKRKLSSPLADEAAFGQLDTTVPWRTVQKHALQTSPQLPSGSEHSVPSPQIVGQWIAAGSAATSSSSCVDSARGGSTPQPAATAHKKVNARNAVRIAMLLW
jgi:hypothetical protein